MIFCISPRIRATSFRPSSWTWSAVRFVVVNHAMRFWYQASPPGESHTPTESRHAGRYSPTKNFCRRSKAGTTVRVIASRAAACSRCCSAAGIVAGIVRNGA